MVLRHCVGGDYQGEAGFIGPTAEVTSIALSTSPESDMEEALEEEDEVFQSAEGEEEKTGAGAEEAECESEDEAESYEEDSEVGFGSDEDLEVEMEEYSEEDEDAEEEDHEEGDLEEDDEDEDEEDDDDEESNIYHRRDRALLQKFAKLPVSFRGSRARANHRRALRHAIRLLVIVCL